jgi:hypothetical protein
VTTSRRPTSRPTMSAMSQNPPFDPFSVPPPNFTSELQEDVNQVFTSYRYSESPHVPFYVAFIPEGGKPEERVSCGDRLIPCGTRIDFLPSMRNDVIVVSIAAGGGCFSGWCG